MMRPAPILAVAALFALAGCGKSEDKAAAAAPVEKAIYMSAADCADGGKVPAEQCDALIETAVKQHEKNAPSFKSLRSCEEASGIERCENNVTGTYRMRLQGFLIAFGKTITSAPLYPSDGGKIGFRDDKKAAIDALSDAFIVSNAALQAAHENAKIAKNVKVVKKK